MGGLLATLYGTTAMTVCLNIAFCLGAVPAVSYSWECSRMRW